MFFSFFVIPFRFNHLFIIFYHFPEKTVKGLGNIPFRNLSSQNLCADFRANFVEENEKLRRLAVAGQGILPRSSTKLTEKTRADFVKTGSYTLTAFFAMIALLL